jgi:hypothetical protein
MPALQRPDEVVGLDELTARGVDDPDCILKKKKIEQSENKKKKKGQ